MKKTICLLLALALALAAFVSCAGRGPEEVNEPGSSSNTEKGYVMNWSWQAYSEYCEKLLSGEKGSAVFHSGAGLCYVKEENGKLAIYEAMGIKKTDIGSEPAEMRLDRTLDISLPDGAFESSKDINGYCWGYVSEHSLILMIHTGEGEASREVSVWRCAENDEWLPTDIPEEMNGRMVSGGMFTDANAGFISFDAKTISAAASDSSDASMLWATFDGGKTWIRPEGSIIPGELNDQLVHPVFLTPAFEGSHGVLPVTVLNDRRNDDRECMVWFETDDGGHTWRFVDK